ncbi:CapA family protein [Luteimonas sp. R10]|uniref:CapA family protein n=1 Tax=Luteimonas sp. R10 TaxID=3108176 RepID=UPI0030861855|nr:CapA family protein [Luteimonas sp. R10]
MTQQTSPASYCSELVQPARPLLEAQWRECADAGSADDPRCVLFFAASTGGERAHVSVGRGTDFDSAWKAGVAAFERLWRRKGKTPVWLRVEAAHAVRRMRWAELEKRLAATKRNYWRFGISFDAGLSLALLPMECGANALLYDSAHRVAAPNGRNLAVYARRRFGRELQWPTDPAEPMWVFETRAVFSDGEGAHPIEHEGRNRGYRRVPDWGAGRVHDIVRRSTAFLARQVKPHGEYHYGWFPCFDRPIPTYNALRHASSTYALLEGWELTGDPAHKAAIDAALAYLCGTLIRGATLPDGTRAAFLVDTGDEIKLGGNAVCLLALSKYAELTGDRRHLPLLEQLASGILHMQRDDGRFVHVLNWPDLGVKAEHRIIYYDGEAAFGLMRLYGLTRDPRWLAAVEKAFGHFIAAEHWRAHDHWLGYCVNELTLYRPEERYYRFGLDNVRGHLDFVLQRITTFPTLLEMMMAARRMIDRLQADPARAHLLEGFDLDKFQRALESRARYLLGGFFWPELAMFFRNPARILDGFFIKHHAYRVRIDDVEHYLSGYVAYWKYLTGNRPAEPEPAAKLPPAEAPRPPARIVWGGDVNLGRRQHYRSAELGEANVLRVPALDGADLRIVNLECVVAQSGEQGTGKGESGPYYYRARPEMLNLLVEAGIDVVATANNHSGDYGREALLEQARWLERAGIVHAGSGVDADAALAPVVVHAGELDIALFSVDATMPPFAAGAHRAGTAFLPLAQAAEWTRVLAPRIAAARGRAHVVLMAVHWGENGRAEPCAEEIAVGHALIDAGADAVLGASAHLLQGIEVYKERPIIHDAGNLLFDAIQPGQSSGGVFELDLERHGAVRVRFVPVEVGFGRSAQLSGEPAVAATRRYADACRKLGCELTVHADGTGGLALRPPSRPPAVHSPAPPPGRKRRIVAPAPDCEVAAVPEEARIEPRDVGPLRLLGLRVQPEAMRRRGMLWVESYWTASEAPDDDIRLDFRATPLQPTAMPAWGGGMDHDPCDWRMPSSRWRPGAIYRDYYGLRPAQRRELENVDLQLSVGIVRHGRRQAHQPLPVRVALDIPGRPDRRAAATPACYFCLHHLGTRLAGIERSALARTRLFVSQLGIVPRVLSSHLDPWIQQHWAYCQALGWADPQAEMINLYEDLLEIATGAWLPSANLPREAGVVAGPVRGAPLHQSCRGSDGKLRRYAVWRDRVGGRLDYVNHFAGDRKVRRERYNRFGQLQIAQTLDGNGRAIEETCFTPAGIPRLRRRLNAAGKVLCIERIGASGADAEFDSEEALTAWWLQQRIRTTGNLFVIDRGPQWTRALRALHRKRPQRLFSVMHSSHLVPDQDPMTGALNSRDRREVLSDRASVEACVVLTEWQREEIAARFPGGCRLATVPHAVEGDVVESDFDARDPDLLLAFVRLAEEKRVEDMVEIMRRVVRVLPGKRLVIHGEGRRRAAIEALIDEYGLQDNVHLAGHVEDVGRVLDRAVFSLLTSKREGFALAVLESLAHGCPVLSYDIRYGPRSMIEHGRNGLLIADGEVEQAAAALVETLSDPARLRAMSAQAYARARDFSAAAVAGRWRDLFAGSPGAG